MTPGSNQRGEVTTPKANQGGVSNGLLSLYKIFLYLLLVLVSFECYRNEKLFIAQELILISSTIIKTKCLTTSTVWRNL
jgi:hypothetical protein